MLTETHAIILLFFAFIIGCIIGGYKNNKLMREYGMAIQNKASRFGRIGFRRHKFSGFEALCLPKGMEWIDRVKFMVRLVWRENLLCYLLSPITRDHDRIVCWIYPKTKLKRAELIRKPVEPSKLKLARSEGFVQIPTDGLDAFECYALDVKFACRLLFNNRIKQSLFKARDYLMGISLAEDRIRMIGKLERGSLYPMLELTFALCQSLRRIGKGC